MKIYTSLIVAAIVAIMIYIVWIGSSGAYHMQTVFLVVPQDHVIAEQSLQVMNDILYIIESSLPQDAHIAHREQSGVFILTVSGDRISDVQRLHHNIVQTISRNVKKYYDIPDGIVIHVVSSDVQPQKNSLMVFAPYVLMIIIAVGAIAGVFAIFNLFDALRETQDSAIMRPMDGKKIFEKFHTRHTSSLDKNNIDRDHHIEITDADSMYDDQEASSLNKNVEDHNVNVHKEILHTTPITSHMHYEDPEILISTDNKKMSVDTPEGFATIPGNLPIVDVAQLGFVTRKNTKVDVSEDDVKEPTEEELKARLNQLLNGKL